MKISELILKGCEMIPTQAIGFYIYLKDSKIASACAIGAAAVAYEGLGASEKQYEARADLLSQQLGRKLEKLGVSIQVIVFDPNDHGIPREEIAARLQRLGL